MEQVFLDFQRLTGTTWMLLSFLLTITLFFQFTRFFSLRNWDVVSLALLVPGLLVTARVEKLLLASGGGAGAVDVGPDLLEQSRVGFGWLFAVTGYFFFRAILDLFLIRRPRPESNLNNSGLSFLAISLLGFLMVEVVTREPDPAGRRSARAATELVRGDAPRPAPKDADPASVLFMSQIAAVQHRVLETEGNVGDRTREMEKVVAQSAAILCHLLIVAALVLIGWRHFDSPSTGLAMATLYLLLPVTAIHVERIDHLLPAVFLVWAVFCFRLPWVSGGLMALAGMFVYPLFLLPLWTSFYWKRSAGRFLLSFAIATAALLAAVWRLDPLRSFMELWSASLAWKPWEFRTAALGIWSTATQFYRLPIFILFSALAIGTSVWPPQKNLADLIALSVALILGVQFWYGDRGGAFVHWYLPLLLLMIFRPNLSEVRPPAAKAVPA